MAPDAGQSAVWFSAGRLALESLARALGPALVDDSARAWARKERALVREGLARLVGRAAFALSATARGLSSETPESLVARVFEPSFPSRLLERELVGEALASLSHAGDFARAAPEDLGSVYEGTLGAEVEVAGEPVALVMPRKRAGEAATQLVVTLRTLLASKGRARAERLASLGVKLEPHVVRELAEARDVDALARALAGSRRPALRVLAAGDSALRLTEGRRRSGSHYTPPPLASRVVELALAPLLLRARSADAVLRLRVCDPSMGTGAFLAASCRLLAGRLLELEHGDGSRISVDEKMAARRRVAERCLFGVDRDPAAVEVARLALWLTVGDATLPLGFSAQALCAGEALLGPPNTAPAGVEDAFDWPSRFASVFRERGGFDAFVGNPPWVSYVGRAAQPLALHVRDGYAAYESFAGYKNLQALFVERSARLLSEGGRLGLLLPSSMSELSGYAPSRRAHDRLCAPDADLTDVGDADFPGVFQPCMVLASTRRAEALVEVTDEAWPLERPDLDGLSRALIEKLGRTPLPARLFGERGLQSMGADTAHLSTRRDERHSVPIRTGSDIEAFRLREPSLYADATWFGRRLRPSEEWSRVRFVVRQTARAPLAALSDGVAFRNSLLAGFEDDEYPAAFLVAYLNSSPIRWLHYMRHRDARQGMPQLKVLHLRRTPEPPSRGLIGELAALGRELSAGGRPWDRDAQAHLDRAVFTAFGLSKAERARIAEASPVLGSPSS
jgi:hypothetical protein